MTQNILYGGDEVLVVHLDPYADMHAADYDFEVELFADGSCNKLVVKKEKMTKVNEDDYELVLYTSMVGRGMLHAIATCYIPDSRCDSMYRKVKVDLLKDSEIKYRII